MSLQLFQSLFAAGVSCALAAFMYRRRPPSPLWPILWYVQLAVLLFCLGEVGTALTQRAPAWYSVWITVSYSGFMFIAPLWLLVAQRACRQHAHPVPQAVEHAALALLGVEAVMWVLLVTNPWHDQFFTPRAGLRNAFHWGWWIHAAVGYTSVFLAVVVLGWLRWRTRESAARRRVELLLAGPVLVTTVNVLYIFQVLDLPVDLTVGAIAGAQVLFLLGVYQVHLFGMPPVALQEIVRHATDAILVMDSRGRLVYANPAAATLFNPTVTRSGTPVAQMLADHLRWSTGSGKRPTINAEALRIQLTRADQPPDGHLFRSVHDETHWWRLHSTAIPLWRGRRNYRSLTLRNVTAELRAEETLWRAHEELEKRVMERTAELLRANTAKDAAVQALTASEQQWRSLTTQAPVGVAVCDRAGQVLEVNKYLLASVGASSAEVFRQNVNLLTDPGLAEAGATQHVSRCLSHGEAAIFDLTLNATFGEGLTRPVMFRCYLSPVMDGDSTITGAVVVTEDVSEQRQAYAALRESEERYRTLVDSSPLGILSCDLAGNIQTVNESLVEMSGAPSVEDSQVSNLLTYPPLVAAGVSDTLRRCLETGEVTTGETHYTSRWGKTLDARYHFAPIHDATGAIRGVQAIVEDITERHVVRRALRESEERYRNLIEHSPLGVFACDAEGHLLAANDRLTNLLGAPSRDAVHAIEIFSNPVLADSGIAQVLRRCLDTGVERAHEARVTTRWGKSLWLRVHVAPLRDATGAITAVQGLVEDISVQKRTQDALEETARELTRAQEIAHLGSLTIEPDNPVFQLSAELYRILGVAPGSLTPTFEALLQYVHPDDRDRVFAAFTDTMDRVVSTPVECRIIRPDGVERTVYAQGETITDEQGTLLRLIGTVQDITERKAAEDELRRSEWQLDKAQEMAALGSYVWDLRTNTHYRSDNLYRLAGTTREAMAERHTEYVSWVHPKDRERYATAWMTALQNQEPFSLEYRFVREDGEERIVHAQGEFEYDDAGAPMRMIGIVQDITERQQAQAALRHSEASLAHAQTLAHLGNREDNLLADTTYWSREIFHIIGEPPREFSTVTEAKALYEEFVHPGDRAAMHRAERAAARGESPYDLEYRIRRRDGTERVVHEQAELTLDDAGQVIRVTGVVQDITERKRAERALRESEQRFRVLADTARDVIWTMNTDGRLTYVSPSAEDVLGYTAEELRREPFFEGMLLPEDAAAVRALGRDLVEKGQHGAEFETRVITKSGATVWSEVSLVALRNEAGDVVAFTGVGRDITARKHAELALVKSEQRYRALMEEASDAIFIASPSGEFLDSNTRACELLGYTRAELATIPFQNLIAPEDLAGNPFLLPTIQIGQSVRIERNLVRKDGTQVPVDISGKRLEDGRFQAIVRDITEQKYAEQAVRESERSLARAQELAHVGSWEWDIRTNQYIPSDELCRIFGFEPGTLGHDPTDLVRFLHAEDRNSVIQAVAASLRGDAPFTLEYRIVRPDGTERSVHAQAEVLRDAAGNPVRMTGILQDITERKEAEEAVRESARNLARAQEIAHVGSWLWDAATDTLRLSDELYRITGISPDTFDGSFAGSLPSFHPDDRAAVEAAVRHAITDRMPQQAEVRIRQPDGSERIVLGRGEAEFGPSGRLVRITGTAQDITERRAAEAAHARLEAQLRHAQKMEAMGTLAGGIAHDFNNCLAGIIGFAELAAPRLEPGSLEQDYIQEVITAGERARSLVGQILAFSRQTEGERRPSELAGIAKEVLRLVRAGIPSTIDIRQDIQSEGTIVSGDPTQLHQVLMNLCTNAAHAMGSGGVLDVRLSRVFLEAEDCTRYDGLSPGPYARLVVRDTGHGMDAATLERIFEPYFTTKEVGQGTGLGLAVVHGIVKGMDGDIKVYSEVGRGTEFQVFFPAVNRRARITPIPPARVPRGTEHVLLVEDEPQVRSLVETTLAGLGYTVTTCVHGGEAVARLEADPETYDVVVTDKIMPHMTGIGLAREIQRRWPTLPVILCTGFQDAGTQEAAQQAGVRRILDKPVGRAPLGHALREVLDAQGVITGAET